ncbi:hypothetical protein ACIBKX_19890 [Streptomyces sp. NPDC050658]|uniref:hypothetical protein n=1 Tax=unclassified Streptomyces TaxID=2593676 RepID=UPI003415EF76
MTVDPSDPETFEVEETESSAETPEADAAEQHTDLAPSRDDTLRDTDQDTADVGDLAEQARVVSLDEDDYR